MKMTRKNKMLLTGLSFFASLTSQAVQAETQANLSIEFRFESTENMRPCPQKSFDYCSLMIPAFYSRSLQITNNSAITANNIVSVLPASLAEVTETGNTCATLAPGQNCFIELSAGVSINPQTLAYVKGSNTNPAYFYVQTA